MVNENKFKTFVVVVVVNFEHSFWSQKSSSLLFFFFYKARNYFPPDIWLLVPSDERLQVGNMFISDSRQFR